MQREEYIDTFFKNIKAQLADATVGKSGLSVHYRDHVVAATWSNELWDIQLNNGHAEPIQRQYDPTNARSSQHAANYFVDALLRANGEEPIPRAPVLMRNSRNRSSSQ